VKPRRLWAIARKELIHIIRDPRSLGMAIAIPMLLLMLYGYALTLDVDHVPLIVWDQSESGASREFVSRFDGSRYFSRQGYVRNYQEMERAIDSAKALVGLVIPRDFADRVETGRSVLIQLIVDGSDSNTATLAVSYAEAVALDYSQRLALQWVQRIGRKAPRSPLQMRPRVWYNADMESRNYIIPGLIAIIIAAMLTSQTVAREWERGTMEQLISTPLRGNELILGKLLPYFAIGFVDVLLAVLLGEFLFRIPLRGSVGLLFGMASIFLAGTLSLGMVVSVLSKNQLLANQLAMVVTFVPSLLLSGFVFAIANMPKPLQLITYLIPARYFVSLLRGIYLKGIGLEILAGEAVLLAAFGAGMVFLANATFKKKLE